MGLLYALQNIRTPLLDQLVAVLTKLGEENVFLVLGLFLLWCVDKKWGFRFLLAGLAGNTLNQLLKAIFLIPRPWVIDPEFQIVEAAREAATGYSFPSGHTQTAATVYGMFAAWLNRTWTTVVCVALVLLVGFSRMYLGVHTPYDVGVSLVTGCLTVVCAVRLFRNAEGDEKKEARIYVGAIVFALVLLAYVLFAPKRAANIAEFDAHGVKNAWTLVGTTAGVFVAWLIDRKWVHYDTKAVWWAQALKLLLGVALVLGIRLGLKPLFAVIFGGHVAADGLRYFIMCAVAGGLWPMTFKGFAGLGKK